ncbi:MAG: 16S rRNA (cytidine(1402)-2'-O)-methyltransferase [Bacteroidetes bacterium]|nr:16S rRNA (cytidine(1402)-2'-O)-methyltransferase [Bacteroidota bacterium]
MDKFLYLVPTPIGNLGDISLRALEVLGRVDAILAEDTRHTRRLLDYYGIGTPMRAFHMHNEHQVGKEIIDKLSDGQRYALVSDAGTPGISDPGFMLARQCAQAGIGYEVLPGATAFVPALIKSGLPIHHFVFEGFLPAKKGRNTALERLSVEYRTMIFYESPYRLLRTLEQMHLHWGDRPASVSRELTKIYEETLNANLSQLIEHFNKTSPRGECVVVVGGRA